MNSLLELSPKWTEFLVAIDEARRRLSCSNDSAWFRGVNHSSYTLTPKLHRRSSPSKIVQALTPDEQDNLKKEISAAEKAASIARHEYNDARGRGLPAAEEKRSMLRADQKALQLRNDLARKQKEFRRQTLVRAGEYEAYAEWCLRHGASLRPNESSWAILADMQHNGVPTRLLDWTESLLIALYFALHDVIETMDAQVWELDLEDLAAKIKHSRAVYVLNPYHLAKKTMPSKAARIVNVLSEREFDYFECFLKTGDWAFDHPLPIFPPRQSRRIVHQEGMFTVHGHTTAPLCAQFQKPDQHIWAKVVLEQEVAVYALSFLTRTLKFNRHYIYQDDDSLGNLLSSKYFTDRGTAVFPSAGQITS